MGAGNPLVSHKIKGSITAGLPLFNTIFKQIDCLMPYQGTAIYDVCNFLNGVVLQKEVSYNVTLSRSTEKHDGVTEVNFTVFQLQVNLNV